MGFNALQSWHGGNVTATAGTAIAQLIPPRAAAFTRVTSMAYRAAGTAHLLQILKVLGSTVKLTAAAAASQAVINVSADPGTGTLASAMAAGDYMCIQLTDGTFFLGKIGSVSTLAVTFTANLPGAASANGIVWFFGAPADQANAIAQTTGTQTAGPTYNGYASVLNTYPDYGNGIAVSPSQYSPLMVYSPNGTAAGIFEQISAEYTQN